MVYSKYCATVYIHRSSCWIASPSCSDQATNHFLSLRH